MNILIRVSQRLGTIHVTRSHEFGGTEVLKRFYIAGIFCSYWSWI